MTVENKKKYLVFQFPYGERWGLPLEEVAKSRAEYYAKVDKDTTYQEEFDYVLNDDYEAVDWYKNNTDPEDFTGKFVQLEKPKVPHLFARFREETERETYPIVLILDVREPEQDNRERA